MSANDGITRGRVYNGARGYLSVNGRQVGYVMNVSWSQSINEMPVEAIGDLLTSEHVTAGITYSGNFGRVVIIGSSLVQAGVSTPIDQVYTRQPFTLTLVDEPTATVYRTFERVKLTTKGADVSKGNMSIDNCSFVCIASRNENGQIDV